MLDLVNALSRVTVTVLYLAAAGSLLLRLRRSRRAERQQIKWVAFVAATLIGFLVAINLLEGQRVPAAVELAVDLGFFVLGVLGTPVAVAVAVLGSSTWNPLGRAAGRGRPDHASTTVSLWLRPATRSRQSAEPRRRGPQSVPARPTRARLPSGPAADLPPGPSPYPSALAWRCWIHRRSPAALDS